MKYVFMLIACALLTACSDTDLRPRNLPGQVSSRAADFDRAAKVGRPVARQEKPSVKLGKITGVEIGQVFALQQSGKLYLIDVRPPLYFRLGHIEGAVNLPLIKYDTRLAGQLPPIKQAIAAGKTVVLYCQNINCPDAYKTAQKLVMRGFSVSIYKGGWEEWKKSGL